MGAAIFAIMHAVVWTRLVCSPQQPALMTEQLIGCNGSFQRYQREAAQRKPHQHFFFFLHKSCVFTKKKKTHEKTEKREEA